MLRTATVVIAVFLLTVPASASARADAGSVRRAAAAAPAPVPGGRTFVISGRGWGHGVGMSQYGALGFALRGTPYRKILAHYYRGTALAQAPVTRVRVLLRVGADALTVSSELPFRVRDGAGVLHQLEGGEYRFGPALKLKIGAGDAKALPGPLFFTPGAVPLQLNGKPYRGSLDVGVDKGKLRAINHVGLEQYLYGVVPDEVPPDWAAEALKAQAVVARSYAIAVRKTGAFDLYDDTRSQVYGGVRAEEAPTTAAVDATARQVLTYGGKVATTFFFSTSGGRTAAIADVWNSQPIPYLVSVRDPYDSISPHHSWGPFRFAPERLEKALKVPGRLVDIRTVVNQSARVSEVVAIGTAGESTTDAATVRRDLGLRSTWFRVGVLGFDRPTGAVIYGGAARLTGIARGLGAATLEQRASAAVWERAGMVRPAGDGTISVVVKPTATTEYRLSTAKIPSPPVRVAVAPLVRLRAPTDSNSLAGLARPVMPGTTVTLQRREGATWRNVATAKVDANGNFVARLELLPGTYRARYAPGRGFVAGTSKVLEVVAA